jgi:hypothetical protein
MKKRLALPVVALMLLVAGSAFAAGPKSTLPLPIGGNFTDATGAIGTFAGTFYLRDFAVENNALVGRGILSGTMTTATGTVLGSVFKQVSLPVSFGSGTAAHAKSASFAGGITATVTCDILNLDLGPLDLNLLGLTVHLNEVVLDIAAQTGAGNLLGNLLCAVTNLLNGAGTLVDIANLLNQILQVLIGLLP